jgi:hypothetical protein
MSTEFTYIFVPHNVIFLFIVVRIIMLWRPPFLIYLIFKEKVLVCYSNGIRTCDLFNICDQYQFIVSRSKIDVYDLVTEYYVKLHLRMMNMTW